jgi:hypothetical protein
VEFPFVCGFRHDLLQDVNVKIVGRKVILKPVNVITRSLIHANPSPKIDLSRDAAKGTDSTISQHKLYVNGTDAQV